MGVFVSTGSGGLAQPLVAAFGPDGNLYVSSYLTNQVLRYQGPSGAQPGAFIDAYIPAGGLLQGPTGLIFGPDGGLYVSSRATSSVLRTPVAADYYKVTLVAGQTVTFSTSTPGDGPGAFVNTLNPHIELYDQSQTLVATGTVLADGRNEQIVFTVTTGGTYYVKVSGENDTEGEYVLDPVEEPTGANSSVSSVTRTLPDPLAGLVPTIRSETLSPATVVLRPGGPSLARVAAEGAPNWPAANVLLLAQFAPTARLIAYGGSGDDDIQVVGGISLPAWLYGGDGNDRLQGGDGNNVLVGGAGDDLLVGGSGQSEPARTGSSPARWTRSPT
jgi:Ca2+-binding RTX toxin-like protein